MKFEIFEEAKETEAPQVETPRSLEWHEGFEEAKKMYCATEEPKVTEEEKCEHRDEAHGENPYLTFLKMVRDRLEERAAEKPEEKTVTLRLVKSPVGSSVVIFAVDEDGDRIPGGTLIKIGENGKISFPAFVNPTLGFPLNERGQLIPENEC